MLRRLIETDMKMKERMMKEAEIFRFRNDRGMTHTETKQIIADEIIRSEGEKSKIPKIPNKVKKITGT